MAWIESHQSLARHRKTNRAVALLGIDRHKLIGHLHILWWWALDNVPADGRLGDLSDIEIALAAEWEGDPTEFVTALIKAGFVDATTEGRWLHDWYDYAGKFLENRTKDAKRGRDMRHAYTDGTIDAVRTRDGDECRYCGGAVNWLDRKGPMGGTYDHIDPTGPTTIKNLVVACRRCNTSKGNRPMTPLPAPPNGASNQSLDAHQMATSDSPDVHLITQPYLTVPNLTQPNPTEPQNDAVATPPCAPASSESPSSEGAPPSDVQEFGAILQRLPGYDPTILTEITLEQAFRGLSLTLEARKIVAWFENPKNRRKLPKGGCSRTFVLNWLAKATRDAKARDPTPAVQPELQSAVESDPKLARYLRGPYGHVVNY